MAIVSESTARILRMVLWQGARFAIAGVVIGVVLPLAAADRISTLLFQVPPFDMFAFTAAVGLLGTTALPAAFLAACRVIGIDPLLSMREQ